MGLARLLVSLSLLSWLCLGGLVHAQAQAPRSLDCEPHAGLQEVAEQSVVHGVPPSPSRLTHALTRLQLGLHSVQALFVKTLDGAAVDEFLAEQAARFEAPLWCGLAQHGGESLLLVAPALGELRMRPGPRPLLVGNYLSQFSEPHLVVLDAHNELHIYNPSRAELAAGIELTLPAQGPVVVQLVAHGPHGPQPLSTLHLGGVTAPLLVVGDGDLGEPMHGVVARLRTTAGRPPLRPNRLLRQAAARHAFDVCSVGRALHVLSGDDPSDRLSRAGLVSRRVGEAIARASSLAAGYNALIASPSHLMSLLTRDFTDIGVGSARRGKRTCLVVLLASFPRYVGR